MIDLGFLKNFCSVKISLKCLIWFLQTSKVLILLSEQALKPKIFLLFKIWIKRKNLTNTIDLVFLKNFCSVNIPVKCLIWSAEASKILHMLSFIMLWELVQLKIGTLEKFLWNKSYSESQDLSNETKFSILSQFWKTN